MIASSSAITTRVGTVASVTAFRGASAGRQLGRHAVEQRILLALELVHRRRSASRWRACASAWRRISGLGLGQRVSETSERSRASSASASRNAHCSSATATRRAGASGGRSRR